ncbi:ATP-binding cassette domain-containing protein [Bradyrhizobium sp. LMTR 3]|uniref:ABC transporter ATP-binding protein n=1 Tax=Bradyrhizobium sp. LMTR 3 TaxID=189873 RepID=UPI000810DB0B|nr:ATP-binding cassette domain-containing protein [Bradyrhizobium sp. LMTR 3]OCK62125.1 nitrate/sulfonate/bicarbonate ABC transporter ATP-binding protein [Bradyrhizobium sp. LMTR 3]
MKLALESVGHAFLGRPVFEKLDLSLVEGEVVALIGPSGCGKTTVLQIAAGLIDPLRGRVRRAYRRHAVVFQEPRLLPWMTARDNIAYGLCAIGASATARVEVAERRAREVGLHPEDLDKFPVELSGGMRQRVAVARALAVDPDVVFFDEPFTAVDVGLKRALQDLVIEAAAREHFSALFVTHDLAEAVRVAHRLVVLSGSVEGLAASRVIEGKPGERNDRIVFEMVETWSRDPAFHALFDGERERIR